MLKSAKKGIEIQKQPILSKTGEAKINKRKRSLKPLYYTGAVAILAGLLVIAFQFDIIDLKQDSSHESANVLPVELITNDSSSETEAVVVENTSNEETLIEPTTNEDTNENLESENINNIAEPIIEEKAEPIQPITTSLNVHVIAGSFSDITNAENYKQNLNESGFSSQILPAGNGMYRVTVKSFAQKSEAIEELQTLRNSTGNQSLWVLAN
jgi:cell division protein FtsN